MSILLFITKSIYFLCLLFLGYQLMRKFPHLFSGLFMDKTHRQETLLRWRDVFELKIKDIQWPELIDQFLTKNLNRTRFDYHLSKNQFIATEFVKIIFIFMLSLFLATLLGRTIFVIGSCAALLSPIISLTQLHLKSQNIFIKTQKELPYFIDYLVLAMESGLDFTNALKRVVLDSPTGFLRREFEQLLHNLELGQSKSTSLKELAFNMQSPHVQLFTETLLFALDMGTDVTKTLRSMSENLQERRFQLAEEGAGKISVKMMIPMMCFVLPSVMIILLAPMILSSEFFY